MEVQQKYQEDMADIGQAHTSAALEPDYDALIKEKQRKNKIAALKRGKEARKQIKNTQQKETMQQQHHERLQHVREVENLRSKMIANICKKTGSEEDTVCVTVQNKTDEENKQQKLAKKKTKKFSKKLPENVAETHIKIVGNDFKTHSPILKPKIRTSEIISENDSVVLQQQSILNSITELSSKQYVIESDNKNFEKENILTKVDKTRYNPDDYIQTTSESITSDSSSSFSDDSSYFSDSGEQNISKEIKTTKYIKCPANDKVQLYDHNKRFNNVYDQPVGVVEKISTWNEPSAMDLAQEIEQAQTVQQNLLENRKHNAKKRGENAALREKIRRDYQILMQNLDQLAGEERKLKASQIEHYPKDVYIQEERRKLLRNQHKKNLNRALKTLLSEESLNEEQCISHPLERQITLTPRKYEKNIDDYTDWKESCCFNQHTKTSKILQNKCKESETSREEQILDMLKKVEKQKRLLLQEFGANLPNDIFNASIKSLFEKDKSVQTQLPVQDVCIQKSLSPEIKVINASYDEDIKDKTEEKKELSVKKVEIAVQTATIDRDNIVQDKSTQVQLISQKENESVFVNDEIKTITKHYPIEPRITIIRHEMDSNNSTSSETINAVTDVDESNNQSPKVILKKKKFNTKILKQTPPKMFHKSCSTRTNKTSSPVKKYSKFLSRSQYSSQRKSLCTEDMPNKKIKMYVDKNGFNIKVKPPQITDITVDVNSQSTQVYSTKSKEEAVSKQQWVQSTSKRIKMKDISDTSTSFASLPSVKPKEIFEALHNNISILEMLDSSANESIRRLRKDISPVSTPDTPSPRTMMMPSNIPHLDRIKKLLKYSTDSQTNNNDTFSKNDNSTSIDSSEYQQNDCLSSKNNDVDLKIPISLEFCLCDNSECKQTHAKFDEIRNYALKNCPQILQKYEDLQTTCAERIISLTNLIEKVRNEQKGMELFSLIDPSDETSLMQLPDPQPMTNDLQNVHRLVENIEAIHDQLVKTLIESQKIIKSKIIKEEIDQIKEIGIVSCDDNAKDKKELEEIKIKPKILSDEKVNIQLNRFKIQKSTFQASTSTPKHNTWLTPKQYEEEMIEKLSKEILEQSKGFNDNVISQKEIYDSALKHSIQTSTDNDDFKNETQKNHTIIKKHFNKEVKNIKEFIPLLNDIPKTSKTTDNMHINGRSKPPVSLLSGPYRTEIESSGHELSTIIEFDTPDTVNKSQNNIRSPLSAKKIAETQITKSTAVVKPSEHINTSHNLDNQHSEKLRNSIKKLSSIVFTQNLKEASIFLDSPKSSKNIGNQHLMENKEQKNIIQKNDKKFQCDTVKQESLQTKELQSFHSNSNDQNKECKDNKNKITSTSSNSFSELSGVSQIASTPSSTILKYASSPEEMEIALKKLGLGWAITTLKKTREASALSSSSNSDVTPINTAKRMISPVKKQFESNYGLPDFSDMSSISIKEASKSTEKAVLLKGRTSTPKLQNSNSNSEGTNTSNTNISENFQEPDDGLIIPNISLTKTKSTIKKLENL
ncbi:uncharacterized protein LOC122716951 isoform X3 [Apis laboriosa]|nr:uncharacterized protein LOC122716951 isoform X3 [Apis laboriosa]XP_043796458.1 uncharacterized protein LOC122716951 isoform X3 [Apis laboriosa]